MKMLSEKVLKILFKCLEKVAENYIIEKKWNEHFNETISFLTDNANADFVNNQLKELLSEREIKEMTKIMSNENGYTFKNKIESKLRKVINCLDASNEEKELFISQFMTCLLEYIKRNHPEIYSQYLDNEMLSELKNQTKQLELINAEIVEFKKIFDDKNYQYTISDYESKLANSSDKNMSLAFFESDDKNFIEEFDNSLKQKNSIFVCGNNRYEVLLSVLYELKKQPKETYIIQNENDWKKLDNKFVDKIFIPYFTSEHVNSVKNNITIFICDNNYPIGRKEHLEIERRKYKFIYQKIIQVGYDAEEAYKILDETHGFFVPLLKKLCEKDYIATKYKYDEIDLKYIMCSLLFGQWTESDSDKKIIEALLGEQYSTFVSKINKYIKCENPLIFNYCIYGENKYYVTSLEDAWFDLIDNLDKDTWIRYIKIINNILFVDDEDENEDKCMYSNVIKEGIYKTLMILKFSLNRNNLDKDINSLILNGLNDIKSVSQWMSLSRHITYISELCPSIFLDRLEREMDKKVNTGFSQLFDFNSNTTLDGNYYIYYLSALEQLLSQNDYTYRSLDILFKLDSINNDYNNLSSPKDTLNKVLCPLVNLSCVKDMDKVSVLKKYIEKNPNNIKFALKNLPKNNISLISNLAIPKYNYCKVDPRTSYENVKKVQRGYLELCYEQMPKNPLIVKKLINNVHYFSDKKIMEDFFIRLSNVIQNFNDNDIYMIELELRKFIYNHRFYCNSDWALDEEHLKYYVTFLMQIKYKNVYYSFKYAFEKKDELHILHPIPYKSNDMETIRRENIKISAKEINEQINRFKENKYDLGKLISVCESNDTTLGMYISRFTGSVYSLNDLMMIINNQKNNVILENYAYSVLENSKTNYLNLINELFKQKYNENGLVNILNYYVIDDDFIKLIDSNASDELKKLYWSRKLNISKKTECFESIFKQLHIYSDAVHYIENLYYAMEYISIDNIYNYLIKLKKMEIMESEANSMVGFYLCEIMKKIKEEMTLNEDMEDSLAYIELKFWDFLEYDEMYFFKKNIAKNANLYSELLKYIYRNDENEFHPKHKKYISKMFELYYEIKFCPGFIDGKFFPEIFDKWVNDFKNNLAAQKQNKLFLSKLGKLCCYSPNDIDNYPLDKHIRIFIENNYSEEFASSFCASEFNKRGAFTCTNGEAEHDIAIKYKNNANYFRINYPKCASLYDMLFDEYEELSNNQKEESKYEN